MKTYYSFKKKRSNKTVHIASANKLEAPSDVAKVQRACHCMCEESLKRPPKPAAGSFYAFG